MNKEFLEKEAKKLSTKFDVVYEDVIAQILIILFSRLINLRCPPEVAHKRIKNRGIFVRSMISREVHRKIEDDKTAFAVEKAINKRCAKLTIDEVKRALTND